MCGCVCAASPADEAEDVEGQVEYGEGSEGDEEQHDSQTPPSPDGQTGLAEQANTFNGSEVRRACDIANAEDEKHAIESPSCGRRNLQRQTE